MSRFSGTLLGAHQRIDRRARQNLERLLPHSSFPRARSILHFEGHNGPDAIKRKSPAHNEPWHYLQPFDTGDTQLIELIELHYKSLIRALQRRDTVRASFEAAWLAHAVVDGLTPAHHYPYEEKLVELAEGRDISERTSIGKKLILPGKSPSKRLKNNWHMWGPKGLFITHAGFEVGVAVILLPLKLRRPPSAERIAQFESLSIAEWYRSLAQEVARLELYDAFYQSGWTIALARRVRRELAPLLVEAVALIWYGAASAKRP